MDVMFPGTCPVCNGTALHRGETCCIACQRRLSELVDTDYCARCGADAGPFERVEGRCPQCRRQAWSVSGLVRVARYDGVIQSLVQRFKFGGRQDLDRYLGGLMGAAVAGAPWFSEVAFFVPVPSPWQRSGRRGFSPTALLAREVARVVRRPSIPLLHAQRYWPRQVGQTAVRRRENVRGVFGVRPSRIVARPPICLIEDVVTTGATLNEASRALRRAGYTQIYAVVIARVP